MTLSKKQIVGGLLGVAAFYSVDGQMVNHSDMARYCVLYLAICLVGLVVSVPYWQMLGLFG